MGTVKRRCKDCGEWIVLDDALQQWYMERKLSLPKRCERCRAKNKAPQYAGMKTTSLMHQTNAPKGFAKGGDVARSGGVAKLGISGEIAIASGLAKWAERENKGGKKRH